MTAPNTATDFRLARVQKLIRRLAHTRNIEIEARLIGQLSLETEAIRRERGQGAAGAGIFARTAAVPMPSSVRARSRRN
jgi:hypothetical protein